MLYNNTDGQKITKILFEGEVEMKKNLFAFLCILSFLTIPLFMSLGQNGKRSDKIYINTHFKMDVIEDGKITADKMLIDLKILEQDDGSFYVEWNEVYIDPVPEMEVVILKPFHHSTLEGSILNVMAKEEGFAFNIDLSQEAFGQDRILQIVGTKISDGFIYDEYNVKGNGLWWSSILDEPIKKELRSTDKKIILPYKEVF